MLPGGPGFQQGLTMVLTQQFRLVTVVSTHLEGLVPGTCVVVGVSSGWCVTSAVEEAQTGCWSGSKRGEGGEGLGRQASATENTCGQPGEICRGPGKSVLAFGFFGGESCQGHL